MAWERVKVYVRLGIVLWKEEGGSNETEAIVFTPLCSMFGAHVIVDGL